ncbi:hypothetical protein PRK78_004305 [Emydomyces testavorans]|uniref:Chromate ion transporter n=1 Tax=Emydomyces testavorans TaxID=2070801 RepID=A0AAF0DJP3_9EURO|nr:hypothetical protein PRK78_004305 [Emydomyces testavorans]
MPLASLIHAFRNVDRGAPDAYEANNEKLLLRFQDVLLRTWHLGFTAFGGPPVHFRIFYQRFVEGTGGKTPWIDEQTINEYQLTSYSNSLPGAIGMFGLSLGVQRLNEVLPDIVYALLSGLNASTVGIIALAAVQLAEKSIKDTITRILVIVGACAGLCYNSLWYFPALMVIGGSSTAIWDLYARAKVARLRGRFRKPERSPEQIAEESAVQTSIQVQSTATIQRRAVTSRSDQCQECASGTNSVLDGESPEESMHRVDTHSHSLSVKWGILIIVLFFGIIPYSNFISRRLMDISASFITVLTVRGTLKNPPRELDLFANMYLAGTIIFGGGPVVIPLLREYVVQPGWVSSRDFLIGLALIQAFPGPNFNFAVFLGSLAVVSTKSPTVFGALLGYIGIFLPGIALALGFQSCWRVMRKYPLTISVLRGMNSTAVGLVFTAVYRLWEIGYLSSKASSGQSLGKEPFWLVVAALTYAENAWFNVPPAVAIVFGGILGLCWYGAVGRH